MSKTEEQSLLRTLNAILDTIETIIYRLNSLEERVKRIEYDN